MARDEAAQGRRGAGRSSRRLSRALCDLSFCDFPQIEQLFRKIRWKRLNKTARRRSSQAAAPG
jgi:hypothetical protein